MYLGYLCRRVFAVLLQTKEVVDIIQAKDMRRIFMAIVMIALTMQTMAQTKINVSVGGKTFTATLENNATAQAFAALLPMTLNMSELNGNEKYNYLDTSLPTDSHQAGTISAGDLKLYGSSCVVLFYKTFQSGYSYTNLGRLDNPNDLAKAVGSGNATVTFSITSTGIKDAEKTSGTTDIYNTDGIRVMHNVLLADAKMSLPQGLYIANGNKFVIK